MTRDDWNELNDSIDADLHARGLAGADPPFTETPDEHEAFLQELERRLDEIVTNGRTPAASTPVVCEAP